ncbi:MAG: hypothetical protein ACKJSG_01125 [Lentisphaeria bacterium]
MKWRRMLSWQPWSRMAATNSRAAGCLGAWGFTTLEDFYEVFLQPQIEDRLVRVPVGMKLDFVAGVGDR